MLCKLMDRNRTENVFRLDFSPVFDSDVLISSVCMIVDSTATKYIYPHDIVIHMSHICHSDCYDSDCRRVLKRKRIFQAISNITGCSRSVIILFLCSIMIYVRIMLFYRKLLKSCKRSLALL